jgi:hypothetical protein
MSARPLCPHCKQELHLPASPTAGQFRCRHCHGVCVYQPPPAAPPAPAPASLAPPSLPSAPPAAPPAAGTSAALRLLPAALLAAVLAGFVVRDRFVASAPDDPPDKLTEEAPPPVELPIDPEPLLAVRFAPTIMMAFGLTMTKEKDPKGADKRLTYADDGKTNSALVQIDGETRLFGKVVPPSGTAQPDPGLIPLVRGRWVDEQVPLGKDRAGRERIGRKSVYRYDEQKVHVTQTVEIVADEQVPPGQTKRRLDTCLVRYLIENQDERPHAVAFRFMLDTFIGSNDGVPFLVPGASGLCTDCQDFATAASVPDFIQALERPSLDSPGTIAHMTLRPGGRLDPPDRVSLCRWMGPLQFRGDPKLLQVEWSYPVTSMANDSCVVIYWDSKDLPPKGQRELGFAYGLGQVSAAEGGGKLGLTVGGALRPGSEFTATAYVNEPRRDQTVTLELSEGLARTVGEATQAVPPLPPGSVSRNSPVTWKVKAARAGRYTLRVKSSTGAAQSQKVTVSSTGGIFD